MVHPITAMTKVITEEEACRQKLITQIPAWRLGFRVRRYGNTQWLFILSKSKCLDYIKTRVKAHQMVNGV